MRFARFQRGKSVTAIDIKRVNIVEKDIEDWLWANPLSFGHTILRHGTFVDMTWVARQYRLPSGILDLFGIIDYQVTDLHYWRRPVLVEVKNQPITSSAITQVCRYAADLEQIIDTAGYADGGGILKEGEGTVWKIIVCPEQITDTLLYEANAVNVSIHTFAPELTLKLRGATVWTQEAAVSRWHQIKTIAEGSEFDVFRQMAAKNLEELKNMVDDAEPLPFTDENGDCSFAENGDLL